jgi:hypothetical protein
MISLKAFAPEIAKHLETTAAAVYERQRALVRTGALPTKGRGRGNGLLASPDNVALIVIAFLATDNLSDTDKRVRRLADAPFQNRFKPRCLLTAQTSFKAAVSCILTSDATASAVTSVDVERKNLNGTLYFQRGRRRPIELSVFGAPAKPRAITSWPPQLGLGLSVSASLDGKSLRNIGLALREMTDGSKA